MSTTTAGRPAVSAGSRTGPPSGPRRATSGTGSPARTPIATAVEDARESAAAPCRTQAATMAGGRSTAATNAARLIQGERLATPLHAGRCGFTGGTGESAGPRAEKGALQSAEPFAGGVQTTALSCVVYLRGGGASPR